MLVWQFKPGRWKGYWLIKMINEASSKVNSFKDDIVLHQWKWSSGRCERCRKQLTFEDKDRESRGKWVAHSRSRRYIDTISDCMILCWECHKIT